VVQALLEGIALCQPQPKLPSELIKYLGKSFCAWHTAIPLLESHVMIFPQVPVSPCPTRGLNMQCELLHSHAVMSDGRAWKAFPAWSWRLTLAVQPALCSCCAARHAGRDSVPSDE